MGGLGACMLVRTKPWMFLVSTTKEKIPILWPNRKTETGRPPGMELPVDTFGSERNGEKVP